MDMVKCKARISMYHHASNLSHVGEKRLYQRVWYIYMDSYNANRRWSTQHRCEYIYKWQVKSIQFFYSWTLWLRLSLKILLKIKSNPTTCYHLISSFDAIWLIWVLHTVYLLARFHTSGSCKCASVSCHFGLHFSYFILVTKSANLIQCTSPLMHVLIQLLIPSGFPIDMMVYISESFNLPVLKIWASQDTCTMEIAWDYGFQGI